MAELSHDEIAIIEKHPLTNSLDTAISRLLSAVQGGDAAFNLRSRITDKNIDSDLAELKFKHLRPDHFNYSYYRLLAQLVIQKAADIDIWKAVFNLLDTVSPATPPPRPVSSIQQTPYGWQDSPEHTVKKDVLRWLAKVIDDLVQMTKAQKPTSKIDTRSLVQPNQSLQGFIAYRKLDIGFADDVNATVDFICHWQQILVLGELKNDQKYDSPLRVWLDLERYAREVLAAQDFCCYVLGVHPLQVFSVTVEL
ncbi:hypothetical protein EMCG_07362 [[Emmonsia] crescens]|uniref:Fungal-type protein kinase domain-containing protein n=1 Tax=[Emmonsia] crescens TaxID=73230 RepID=A0A0G2J5Q3_9EURO|nr:hypothetical protein EMCG_07362 [Emmonsia crescens UAMH 3008]